MLVYAIRGQVTYKGLHNKKAFAMDVSVFNAMLCTKDEVPDVNNDVIFWNEPRLQSASGFQRQQYDLLLELILCMSREVIIQDLLLGLVTVGSA
jgi:hypothetical protein